MANRGAIKVVCRVRPQNGIELGHGGVVSVKVPDASTIFVNVSSHLLLKSLP